MASVRKFVIYNLRETYHELGKFDFKIVLDPKFFKNGSLSEVKLTDSDGRDMKYTTEIWGRKINCTFCLDRTVPDGVSTVKMLLRDDSGHEMSTQASFWIIK